MVRVSGEVDNPRRTRLRVAGVTCERGERPLFAPASFEVGRGDVVWLRGANGSGKTTLLRTIAGLAHAATGTIDWPGSADTDASEDSGRPARFVYVAHANALHGELGADEALRFLLRLGGGDVDDAAVGAALARFGLAGRERTPTRSLSQGQRRRVALARLAARPQALLWLLDEPYDALDAEGIAVLDALLAEHCARGGSVLLTSHVPLALRGPAPREITLDVPPP